MRIIGIIETAEEIVGTIETRKIMGIKPARILGLPFWRCDGKKPLDD
ncbi:hypothetical protein SAMN05444406_1462 [Caldicoprobacter faecalis]|uniref:Uncharacterized protein n=2 Tax=Caldicoprobacteraceae TaxID=715221 RepID=A0A1I5YGP1_9FIRM|nr:hypothetical protein SAMN05444406_1462 [Caldicoprobacter faecalis]